MPVLLLLIGGLSTFFILRGQVDALNSAAVATVEGEPLAQVVVGIKTTLEEQCDWREKHEEQAIKDREFFGGVKGDIKRLKDDVKDIDTKLDRILEKL